MGLFNKLLRKPKENSDYAQVLSGAIPIFSMRGRDIFASDAVQAAIGCIVHEMKKLQPQHVRKSAESYDTEPVLNSNIQRLLDNPNPLMSTSDFIEKVLWQLFFNYNSFVLPTYTETTSSDGSVSRTYTGLYPINPSQVDFKEDRSGTLSVVFRFENNYVTEMRYSDIIHIRYRYAINDYMGGNEFGQPDNKALLNTLNLNDEILNGISKAARSSYTINGVIKYNTLLDKGKMTTAIKELENHLRDSEDGFLPLDLAGEFIPFKRDIKLVDPDTLKFIDEKILRFYGVPLPILTGDYTKEQYEAFFQKTLEPLIASMSQAFTRGLFSPRELGFGNSITLREKSLIFMSTTQKLEMVRLLGDSGALYENEKRMAFGLPPLPELVGVRKQSLNYVDTKIADQYQLNRRTGNSTGLLPGVENQTSEDQPMVVNQETTLNGSQTQALLAIIQDFKVGAIDHGQAVNIIAVAIGVDSQTAKNILEGNTLES